MKYKYRGALTSGKIVDIIDFDGKNANCDHGMGYIDIDEFNTIFIPKDVFKRDILKIKNDIKEKVPSKKEDK